MIVNSTGGDPYLSYKFAKPFAAQRFTLALKMSSDAGGNAQLFWSDLPAGLPFHRDKSVTFAVTHDGKSHEYRVAFESEGDLRSVRLDPARNAGELKVASMSLLGRDGKTLHEWSFAKED